MKSRTWMWTRLLCAFAALVCSCLVEAQSLPRLKPIPPRGPRNAALAGPAAIAAATSAPSPWRPLNHQPPFTSNSCNGGFPGAANPLLLTDGSVIVQDAGCQDWWRLTPDNKGSYANGAWSQIASLPSGYAPLYHSSGVLPDGRVVIMGGEYNFFVPMWTTMGAIYDPVADIWKPVNPPAGWTTIGDAQSVVLANGKYMQANCCTSEAALLDPVTLTWTATGTNKFDANDEEGWTLLPNGKVLAVDAYVPIPPTQYDATGMNSELYNPRTGAWKGAGSTVVQLWDSTAECGGFTNNTTFEVGPAVLRADGTVFYTGSNTCPDGAGNTAVYSSYAGKWRAGPMFPEIDGVKDINIADGPAAWEPNDKVLMMASPGFGNPPSFFFEWDGKHLSQVPGPPNAPTDGSFYGNMLVLPTGQILLTDFSGDIELYTPHITAEDREFQREIAPLVFYTPQQLARGKSYQIYGIGFNGVTQGAAYGDDAQAATNFPLVRITNVKTSHVFYSRTHDHSSMAVASDDLVWTHFDVSAVQETGPSLLQVVANGVASRPVHVVIH